MKRFRYNGRAMSKLDMAFEMKHYRNIPWDVCCDAFSYEDMVGFFTSYLKSREVH